MKIAVLFLLCLHVASGAAPARPSSGIGVNIWAPEWYAPSITKFDAEKLAAAVAATGSDVAFTFQGFSQDHFGISYFPTALGPQHKNLKGRDHLKEYVTALHARNIKVYGYYSFPDKSVWDRNADWRQRNAKDEEIKDSFGGPLCPNSPYHDHFIARIAEIVQRYEIDGFLIDSVAFHAGGQGCYCRYCQRKFRALYGTDMPRRQPGYEADWRRLVEFRYQSIEELYADARRVMKAIRPNIVLTHNAFALQWSEGEDFERTLALDDVVTSIGVWDGGGPEPIRNSDMIWKTGLLTRYLRGISGKPVLMQMGAYMYTRDYQALPVRELRLAAATIIAGGGSPIYIGNAFPDGTVDEVLFDRVGQVFKETAHEKEYLSGTEDLHFAALYFSKASQVFADSSQPAERRYLSSFEGAQKALVEGHIPFEIIGGHGLNGPELARYKVLVIPDGTALSDADAAAVRAFVKNGGGLVATSRTSLVDGNGNARTNFGLADVFGADYLGMLNYATSFIKPGGHAICSGIDSRENIPIRPQLQMKVKARPGAEPAAALMLPSTEFMPGIRTFSYAPDVAPGAVSDLPAAVASGFGSGRSVYFSGDVTGAYGTYGYPGLRKLLLNAVRWASRDTVPVSTNAPLGVELSCFRQGARMVLHLVNYSTSQLRLWERSGGPAAEEGVPVRDVKIRVAWAGRPVKRVFAVHANRELKFERKGDDVEVTVPEVDVQEVLVME